MQIASLNFLKKAILPTLLLCAFFLAVPDHIKAQIVSIISEDGDGIIGVTSLMNAAINDDVEAVKFFAKSGISVVNQKNVGGATALHIAARRGNLEICKILVESGANVNIADNEGWTPLMRAALAKNADLIKFLINQGSNPKKMNLVGETVIINSASSGCSACLEQLLSSYNFVDNFNIDILKNQIEEALVIANNKNDSPTQLILKEYLNSEVNKDKIYSIINNRNSEMLITSNNNFGDGVVVVKSLNDMPSSVGRTDGKTDYKFYKMEAKQPLVPFSQAPQKPQKFHSNIVNKVSQDAILQQQPSINLNDTTSSSERKVFIFKGSKKPFSPLNTTPNTTKPVTSNTQPANDNNIKNISNPTPQNPNSSNEVLSVKSITNNSPAIQYKFLGQKKPFVKK